jgi:hypothetical protein
MAIVLDGTTGITTPALDSTARFATADMPLGSVIQVVTGTYSVDTSTTSTSFVDTGLTATITLSSATSKVLVLVTMPGVYKASTVAASAASLQILRAATTIHLSRGIGFNNATHQLLTPFAASVLDSPATTSATVYKLQIKSDNGNQVLSNVNADASATITLLEIAA